jgi:O-antigen ligase
VRKKALTPEAETETYLKKIGYDQIPMLALLAFAAYIVTWFLQLGSRISFLGSIRFEFLLAILLVSLAFVVPRQKGKSCDLYGYIAAFLFALLTQIPFSYNVDYSWLVFVDRVVKFAFMTFFIVVFVRSPTALKFLIGGLVFAWLKMGQEEWVGRVTGSLVWENQGVMRLNGVTGLYSHPTSLSGLGLGMIPFIYYLFPIANKWGKAILLLLLVFALNIVLYTGARTGYVGFLLFAFFVFWRSKYKLKFMVTALVIGLVAVPFIPDQYKARFESITGSEAEGHSKMRRLEILQDAAIIFTEHPFGVGVSAFPTVREKRFGRNQDTHNLYMEVLTNLGIQGFIIWAILIAAIFRNVRRLSKELSAQLQAVSPLSDPSLDANSPVARHVADLRLLTAMLNAITAYVFIRLIVGFFGMDLYEIYWWFTAGVVIAIHNMTQVAARITAYHVEHGRPPATAAADAGRRAPVTASNGISFGRNG